VDRSAPLAVVASAVRGGVGCRGRALDGTSDAGLPTNRHGALADLLHRETSRTDLEVVPMWYLQTLPASKGAKCLAPQAFVLLVVSAEGLEPPTPCV
jgi:hypothetical protein